MIPGGRGICPSRIPPWLVEGSPSRIVQRHLVVLAALRWTRRASGLMAGVAVIGFFFNPFFDWDGFLISQLLLMFGVQTGCLVAALLASRSFACGLAFVDDRV